MYMKKIQKSHSRECYEVTKNFSKNKPISGLSTIITMFITANPPRVLSMCQASH